MYSDNDSISKEEDLIREENFEKKKSLMLPSKDAMTYSPHSMDRGNKSNRESRREE